MPLSEVLERFQQQLAQAGIETQETDENTLRVPEAHPEVGPILIQHEPPDWSSSWAASISTSTCRKTSTTSLRVRSTSSRG